MGPVKVQWVALTMLGGTPERRCYCSGLLCNLDGNLSFDLKRFSQELWSESPASKTWLGQRSQVVLPSWTHESWTKGTGDQLHHVDETDRSSKERMWQCATSLKRKNPPPALETALRGTFRIKGDNFFCLCIANRLPKESKALESTPEDLSLLPGLYYELGLCLELCHGSWKQRSSFASSESAPAAFASPAAEWTGLTAWFLAPVFWNRLHTVTHPRFQVS